jgi:hypothetical protein
LAITIAAPIDAAAREVTSDTGELYRNWGREYGLIDSPRSQVVYGFVGRNSPLKTTDLKVDARTDFAVVALSSLTDAPITESDNLLLSTIGRARNTGEKRQDGQIVDFGTCPILAEVIETGVSIRTSVPNLMVWAINAEGFYVGRVPATYADGVLTFRLGEVFPSIYYLIRTE